MPTIQIKDVPPDTHATLRKRAAAAHQSLQEYLRQRLIREASQPTLEEIFERIEEQSGGEQVTMKSVVESIRADRDSR